MCCLLIQTSRLSRFAFPEQAGQRLRARQASHWKPVFLLNEIRTAPHTSLRLHQRETLEEERRCVFLVHETVSNNVDEPSFTCPPSVVMSCYERESNADVWQQSHSCDGLMTCLRPPLCDCTPLYSYTYLHVVVVQLAPDAN